MTTSRTSDAQLDRALVEAAPDAMLVIEAGASHFLLANAAAERLLDYTRAELLQLGPADILAADELARLPEARRQFETTGSWRGEWWLRRKDGGSVPVEVISTRHTVDGRQLYQANFRDMTFCRAARLTLARREAQLAEAQHLAHLGSWEWDLDTNQLHWSDEHYRILGLEPRAEPPTLEEGLAFVYPDDLAAVRSLLETSLRDGEPYATDLRIVQPDGALHWIHSRGALMRDVAGRPTRMIGTAQDITARVRAAAQAERERRESAALLDSTSDGIYGLDHTGRCTFINRAGAALLGYAPAEVIGQQMHPLVHHHHPDGRIYPVDDCPIGQAGQTGQHVRRDSEVFWRKDGTAFSAEYSCSPLVEAGSVTGVVVTVIDITERKQAETALRESEERFRSSFEHAAIGKALVALDGRWLQVNAALCELTGYSESELQALTFQDLTHPDDLAADLVRAQHLLDGVINRYQLEKRYYHKTGRLVWVLLNVCLLRAQDGQPQCFLAGIQDITERKQAETALRESEERFRQFAEHIDQVFWMTDAQKNQILYVNPAYERIWGHPTASVLADARSWLASIHVDDRQRVLDAALTRQTSGDYEEDYRIIRPDGEVRWIHDRGFPVRDANGQVYRVLGVATDVTREKLVDLALRQSKAELERALETVQRSQAQVVQQERLRALGEMASGIAHDFNNALAMIMGYAELLLARPTALENQAQVRDYLQIINSSAEDAAGIVSRLREFYRHREPDELFTQIDLAKLFDQVISLTQPRWKDQTLARGAVITIQTQVEQVPPVPGNEADLRQALVNLVFNAVDALPEGGPITLGARVEDEQIVLEVTDSGVGMPEEVRRRCLEPFFTTKGEHGSGMGLAMVHGIARRHGGELSITSAPASGTVIAIRLPLAAADRVGLARAQEAMGGPTRPLRVLVVDDDPRVRQFLTSYLVLDGHQVEVAVDGEEGLSKLVLSEARLPSAPFDVVITDQAMPKMSGDQFAAAIKRFSPNTPVLLLTGFGDMMQAAGEHPAGVDAVLTKPIKRATLRQALTAVLTRVGAGDNTSPFGPLVDVHQSIKSGS